MNEQENIKALLDRVNELEAENENLKNKVKELEQSKRDLIDYYSSQLDKYKSAIYIVGETISLLK